MLEFQERRKLKGFIYSRLILVILLALLFFLIKEIWSVYQKERFTRENLSRAQADLESLEERQAKLLSEISRLKTDAGAEREIRERFGLSRPGEEVYVIVDKNGSDEEGEALPTENW